MLMELLKWYFTKKKRERDLRRENSDGEYIWKQDEVPAGALF